MENLAEATLRKVKESGKGYFEDAKNLAELDRLQSDPGHIPGLIPGLNFEDTGQKQPCTALAIILKIGKRHPERSIRILEGAFKKDEAPAHYLSELIYKIHRKKEAEERKLYSRSILGARK
jgi:hypothetical protein